MIMNPPHPHVLKRPSKGAALIIVLAFVVLVTVLGIAYFSRTTTDRQLAQASFNDTGADLLGRSALDIVVSIFKQEIAKNRPVTAANIQPQRAGDDPTVPNLIRRSFSADTNLTIRSQASTVNSAPVDPANPKRGEITFARWNSHYLIPAGSNFTAPDWVLVTSQGPNSAPAPNAVIGRYAFAVYDEGGLIDINIGGVPTYANLTRPTRRRLAPKYPLEESEIILVGQVPKLTPPNQSGSGTQGNPVSFSPKWNQSPTSYSYTGSLPAGLSVSPTTGAISGTPTSSGTFNIQLTATNGSGTGPGIFALTIAGALQPASTPWPVNLARKGTIAFADLTTLPSTPQVTTTQINKLVGWRNYATTQQLTSASFDSPSFTLPPPDNYAHYFLGPALPLTTPFTTVRNDLPAAVVNGRTDQAVMSRQELIKLQRTIGFDQSLLQYLGTFSREQNEVAPDWPQLNFKLTARFDISDLDLMLPNPWYNNKNNNGHGHAYGRKKHSQIGQLFGLIWVNGDPVTYPYNGLNTDPRYYGHWQYIGKLKANNNPPLQGGSPDFFQIIDYAMNQAIGYNDPNHMRTTFNVGAALIDQYDNDDVNDGVTGNTITIIDYDGNPANYAYGIERMSYDAPYDATYYPSGNQSRPPSAPYPPPVPSSYVLLNRRFENVGEFGYAYNPASTTASKSLDFASSTSHDKALLDFFTYNTASPRAGIVNLNTRNGPVLASIIRGALLHDLGSENTPTSLVSQTDALIAGQAIVAATTATGGAAVNRADVARLAAAAAAAVPATIGASDEAKQTIARTLAEVGQTRTWNLMIDVIAQTGKYKPNAPDLTGSNFIVQGEKRYWLHIALDRDDGTVLGQQLEEVME